MINQAKEKFKAKGEIYLRIKVSPNMPVTRWRQVMADETFKVDVAAKPEKGRANAELINFLAREFAISRNNVKIIGGAGDRLKLVKLVK